MKYLYYTLICFFCILCSCSDTAPEAYVIKAGMSRDEVIDALKKVNISESDIEEQSYNNDNVSKEMDIRKEIKYLGVDWDSMEISFNKEGKVDKVSFYLSSEDTYFNKSRLVSEISKELGEKSGWGTLISWSVENKWVVSIADNEPPFPKCLTYWYQEYMDSDTSTKTDKTN